MVGMELKVKEAETVRKRRDARPVEVGDGTNRRAGGLRAGRLRAGAVDQSSPALMSR